MLTDQEYPFCDEKDRPNVTEIPPGATWFTTFNSQTTYPSRVPGAYFYDANARVPWRREGGDWYDDSVPPVRWGTTPYAVATASTAKMPGPIAWDVTALVNEWVTKVYRNAGFMLIGANNSTTVFASRWSTVAPVPQLIVNGTPVATLCRSIEIQSGGTSSLAENAEMKVAAGSRVLVWFDLSQVVRPITTATLQLQALRQTGAATNPVNLYRLANPQDPEDRDFPIGPIVMGLAANYDRDIAIESDPNVLFVQKFANANFDDIWLPGPTSTSPLTGRQLCTAPDTNGFTPAAGIYNGLRIFLKTGNNGVFGAHWSPNRGTYPGGRLKAPQDCEELFARYLLMWGLDWDVVPDGGKMPGWDGRYTQLGTRSGWPVVHEVPGMGRGNGGTGSDGFTGWSARGNYDNFPRGDIPTANFRGLGQNDIYLAGVPTFGPSWPFDQHYLGLMRKGEWNCIETHIKMNSVDRPDQKQRRIISLTWAADATSPTGKTATAVLAAPESDPLYATGQVWFIAGVAHSYTYPDTDAAYQGRFPITVKNSTTFTYPIVGMKIAPGECPSAGTPTGNCWLTCAPTQGNPDGIFEAHVNGRLAMYHGDVLWRHNRWLTDGSAFNAIDNWWAILYHGGGTASAVDASCYLSNIVVAKSRIGPMVVQ
jgi:hypothetical protein